MRERGIPTLADARRQVWVRELIAWLLGGLGLIFLLLFLVKFLYVNLPVLLFFFAAGEKVRRSLDTFLRAWPVLVLLLQAIPPWQPIGTLVITPQWDFVYAVWGGHGRVSCRWAPEPVSLQASCAYHDIPG